MHTRMGWDQMIPLSPYGDRWRKARKIAHTSLNKVAATQFWPFHEKHCGMYLNRLLDSPGTYIQDFKLYV